MRDFWKGKRVLVTGHTGFKGSWLCLWLQRLGAEIVGYALQPPSQPNLFEIARVAEGMSSLTGDIRDLNHLTAAMRGYRPQIVSTWLPKPWCGPHTSNRSRRIPPTSWHSECARGRKARGRRQGHGHRDERQVL